MRGRLLLIPHPYLTSVSQMFMISLMQAAFVVLYIPRGVRETEDTVLVKIKIWGHAAFLGWLPKTMLVQEILDAWLNVGTMVSDSPNICAVGFGCTMNP